MVMCMTRTQKLIALEVALLFGGMVFSWYNLLSQFANFHALYGTIFRLQGITIPNPFLTPCFFGSLGYVAALFWSVFLLQGPVAKSQRWLRNFLLFSVVFALSVVGYETAQYFHLIGGVSVSCTPGAAPWATPCFTGMIIFALAFAVSVVTARSFAQDARLAASAE